MSIYLSVDVDFWQPFTFEPAFLEQLLELNVSTVVVEHHHELVPHVKEHDFDTLVNMDYHSDIVTRKTGTGDAAKLNCANWANYVDGADRHFIWTYPVHECYKPLHGRGNGTTHGSTGRSPFKVRKPAESVGWAKVEARHAWMPPLDQVVAVGIALSPFFTRRRTADLFLDWLHIRLDRQPADHVNYLLCNRHEISYSYANRGC
jgi:hypothetical protein